MENVAKIVIGTENGAWKEAKIIDKKGNVKVINNVNEIINILSKFAISENIKIEDLFKREDKIQKIDMKSKEYLEIKSGNIIIHENGKVEGKPQVEEIQEDKKNVEASKKEDSVLVEKEEGPEKKKKGIKFRYIVGGALLVATLIGGTVLLHSPYSDENKAKNRKNNKVYSQTYDNEFSVTEHPGSANEVFNEKLDETYDNIDSYVTQVSRIEDKVYTEDEINALVNKLNMMAVSGVTEVENMLNGKKMKGNNYQLSSEDYFAKGTCDYVAVGEFTNLRNNIINNAYNVTKSKIKKEITAYLDYLNMFILGIKPINNTDIYFSDLGPLAQYIIASYDMAYIQPEVLKYQVNINGNVYTRNDLIDLAQTWLGDSYERLLFESATKRR